MTSLLLPDLLFTAATLILSCCVGFVCWVAWDLHRQDQRARERADQWTDWSAGRRPL